MNLRDEALRRIARRLQTFDLYLILVETVFITGAALFAPKRSWTLGPLDWFVLPLAAFSVPMAFLWPRWMLADEAKRAEEAQANAIFYIAPDDLTAVGAGARFVRVRATGHILGSMLVWAPFICGTVMLLAFGISPIAVGVPASCLALLLVRLPTFGRVRAWAETRPESH